MIMIMIMIMIRDDVLCGKASRTLPYALHSVPSTYGMCGDIPHGVSRLEACCPFLANTQCVNSDHGRTPATGYNDPMGPLSALDHLYPTKYPAVPHRPVTPSKELTPDEKERPLTPESELGYRYPGSYNAIQAWQDHVARRAALDSWYPGRYPGRYPGGYPRYHSPLTEWRARPATPTEKQVGYNYAGQPIYTRGGLTRRPLSELLDPLPYMPMSRITRDPWWWEYPELRPFQSPYAYLHPSPFYLRDSFLSPVKRTYLWDKHPIRPFAHVY